MVVLSAGMMLAPMAFAQSYVLTGINFPGASFTSPIAINKLGVIVGAYQDSGGNSHGFSYSSGTSTSIDVPGAIHTEAWGINDLSQIVGWYINPDFTVDGFILSGGSFTTLDTGTEYTIATGINNSGQVVGEFRGHGEPGVHGASGGAEPF